MPPQSLPISGDSTAMRTLGTIASRGPMTVRQLVEALGVTTTAVREQVNRLRDEGWLVCTQRRGRTGRPADVFAVTDKANRLFAGQVDEFARLLVDELVAGSGPQKSRELLKRVGERMARDAREQVGDGPPAERLQRLARFLAQQGDLVQLDENEQGSCLTMHRCPYGSLADQHHEICRMERETFSELVGASVRLRKSSSNGHRRCEFTFSPESENADATQPTERR